MKEFMASFLLGNLTHGKLGVFAAFFSILAASASADVLMIDFNFNPEELAVIEREAAPERVHVFPAFTTEEQSQLRQLERWERARVAAKKRKKPWTKPDGYTEALAIAKRASASFKRKLTQYLAQLQRDKVTITDLVITGHHTQNSEGGDQFFGLVGNLNQGRLAALLKRQKSLKNLRGLLLLGCYTGDEEEVLEWKRQINPEFVFGYTRRSLEAHAKPGLDVLALALRFSKRIETESENPEYDVIADLRTTKKAIDKINGRPTSVCYGNTYIDESFELTLTHSARSRACRNKTKAEIEDLYRRTTETYLRYRGLPQKDPPSLPRTDDADALPPSDLKTVYEKVFEYSDCTWFKKRSFPDPTLLRQLLFFDTIRHNFFLKYRTEMATLGLSDLKKADRATILETFSNPKLEAGRSHAVRKAVRSARKLLVESKCATQYWMTKQQDSKHDILSLKEPHCTAKRWSAR